MKRIIIGADVVPEGMSGRDPIPHFISGEMNNLVEQGILDLLKNADFRVVNLEVPLTDKEDKLQKSGPNLMAPTATIKGYQTLGVDLVTIANNHILDQNISGFKSTLETLDNAGIKHVGGGMNYEDAIKPQIVEVGDKKIGFYATCQHEFSWVQDYGSGANGFDPLYSFDHIAELKAKCDYVIVLYHAGVEHYRYTSPYEQRNCRRMIEKGADLVLMQHTHCISCEEDYKGGKILYGQGDFIFDHSEMESCLSGLLVTIDIDGDDFKIGYIPVERKDGFISLSKNPKIIEDFNKRSEEIKDPKFLEDVYYDYGRQRVHWFTNGIMGYYNSKWIRFAVEHIDSKRGNKYLLHGDRSRRLVTNYITNPAHRELYVNVFAKYTEKEAEWQAKQKTEKDKR